MRAGRIRPERSASGAALIAASTLLAMTELLHPDKIPRIPIKKAHSGQVPVRDNAFGPSCQIFLSQNVDECS